jgi:Ca-activated chloride channel family protein
MVFKDIWIIFFIPAVVFALIYFHRIKRVSGVKISSSILVKKAPLTPRLFLTRNLIYLRAITIVLFMLALARPQEMLEEVKRDAEGIDIVLAIDASGSMRALDFKTGMARKDRLDVVKEVVERFIRARDSDRIGMIAFAGRAYTVCPLTLDYDWLIRNLERVRIGAIEDGTAIGSAISSSLNRLKDTAAKSKIIILLTDGVNNAGSISPQTAAEAAKALGIKIYTVGAGSRGLVPYPVQDVWGNTVYQNVRIELEEEMLRQIAERTGGKYFRATDAVSLRNIYLEIDRMERTLVEEAGFRQHRELFVWFLSAGLVLLLTEIVLSNTLLRTLP